MERNRENNQHRIEELYSIFLQHPTITTDSRNIKKEDLFFALKGDNFNGNKFAEKAIQDGASFAIIDEKQYKVNDKCFLVEDVLSSLQELANYHRKQFKNLRMLAITGTNGKTTTKELCYQVLSQKYNTIATLGNFNNHIGVPLTLLRINKETEFAIIEMGANHVGEIDFLCKIAEPIYGLITNIGRAHLEGFGSFEGVIRAKTELFKYLDRKDHYAIINMDDNSLFDYSKIHKNKFYTYSITNKIYSETASLEYKGIRINSNLVGTYNSQNLLAAITIGELFDIPLSVAAKAIEDYEPSNHRSQIQKTKNNTLILDCYNANPSSINAALQDFKNLKADSKYAFIGAMKELGTCSEDEHKHVIDLLESMNLKGVVLVGKEFEKLRKEDMLFFESSNDAKEYFFKNQIKGATILIKGSNSTKMEVLADVL